MVWWRRARSSATQAPGLQPDSSRRRARAGSSRPQPAFDSNPAAEPRTRRLGCRVFWLIKAARSRQTAAQRRRIRGLGLVFGGAVSLATVSAGAARAVWAGGGVVSGGVGSPSPNAAAGPSCAS